ncbi:MAG: YciI family protein [Alphaproteobacteria bacterium]|nr:YciI family protein [Alphaproteobacteria bacterium]
MLFAIHCIDRSGQMQLRLDHRPAHLEHLKAAGARIKFAGPLLDEAGEKPVGSLILVECADLAAARAFADADPYAKAGLFERVHLAPWRHVLGSGL